jgi:multidrug efflux pump subunit AcrA (membrane-fusion protein)
MRFVSPAFPATPFEGRLVRVANTLDARTGTVSAFFEVPNPERLLRIGMRVAAVSGAGAAQPLVEAKSADIRHAVATGGVNPSAVPAPVTLTAVVKPKPELTAEVAAPLWGRIEFAARRLNVGDRVEKGEDLAHVILELAADERYQMNARAVDIDAERELSKTRREQAEKRAQDAAAALAAAPDDPFLKQEAQLLERISVAAQQEEVLLGQQVEVFKGVMKRRDPKITVVKAPIAGVITEIGFRPGELNGTDEFRRLFTIVDTSAVILEAQVYDHQSAAVLKGTTRASFTSPGFDVPRPLQRPLAISGAINPETGALSVLFDVANPGRELKIGGTAQIVVRNE